MYWVAVGSLAVLAGVLVSQATAQVEAAKRAWGETRGVMVAIAEIEPGDSLAAMTQLRQLPAPMVPDDAVDELDPAALATQRIALGELVVAHDVSAVRSPQAFIPDGWLAVSVSEPVRSGARTGDAVSVSSGGVVLAADGVVVGSVEQSVLVAVPASEAAQVAQATTTGDVALLIKG